LRKKRAGDFTENEGSPGKLSLLVGGLWVGKENPLENGLKRRDLIKPPAGKKKRGPGTIKSLMR